MEGHMHEHGPLYISVSFVMFDEGGWCVVCVEWSGVVWCGVETLCARVRLVSSRGQSNGVRIVVSCHHESGCVCACIFVDVFNYVYIYIYMCVYEGNIQRSRGEPLGQVITLRLFSLMKLTRLRVHRQNARMFYACGRIAGTHGVRFECTHGGGFFSVPHHTHDTPHTPLSSFQHTAKQHNKTQNTPERR